MRTLAGALQDLLDPRVLQSGTVELREDDVGSSCPPTKLGSAGQAVTLRFSAQTLRCKNGEQIHIPQNRWLFPLFNERRSEPPVCRSCDYMIFYPPRRPEDPLFVFLCELKSGRDRGGARVQLRNSELLAAYILSVVRLHGAVSPWPRTTLYRGIILAPDAPLTRGATRPPARAEYRDDGHPRSNLKITYQRPGLLYPIQFFCE